MKPAPLEGGVVATPVADAGGDLPVEDLQAQLCAAGRGDASAFADLYDSVAPRVFGLVLRVLRNRHQSEEVTQEVFLQVWEASNRFDPARGSALWWIMTMAHRRAVDRVRSAGAQRRRDPGDAERSLATAFDQTAEAAHCSLVATQVREALGALSPIQRQALELAYFGGRTHLEVTDLLQIPPARPRLGSETG